MQCKYYSTVNIFFLRKQQIRDLVVIEVSKINFNLIVKSDCLFKDTMGFMVFYMTVYFGNSCKPRERIVGNAKYSLIVSKTNRKPRQLY